VIDVILRAFSQAIPEQIPAGNNAQYGRGRVRGRYPDSRQYWQNGGNTLGGWGGHFGGDGQSALHTTTHGDCRRVPIEVEESEGLGLIERFELVTDSGGAGRWRGGLGTRMEVVTPLPAYATLDFDRGRFPPWGLFGGKDGMAGRGEVIKPGEAPITGSRVGMPVPAGTRVVAVNNGGGGWGDPLERDLGAIEWDLRQGYVSREAAERDYGVVFNAAGDVDPASTRSRRAELGAGERAPSKDSRRRFEPL
jgi:N-methylhydantoinase B